MGLGSDFGSIAEIFTHIGHSNNPSKTYETKNTPSPPD